ncbi:hypothetical protein GCM10025869_00140 [Homoserinibacter gongjuensis]|uniref:Membrane transport protein MMPL domain-containing protein n=1 Tax=Homoserinibacter gongjuensis TaxID=1162968 RepID=A0ABQ6JS20_9MICO|nr:hypothetical protein GCM10025869_00140 [Homoserinibacter gongjuensis]
MSHAAPSRTRRTLRILIPALLVLVWLTVAAIGGPYFGKVSEVSSNDPTAYLPTTAEATQVQERLSDFLGTDAIPAVVLVLGNGTLSDAQLQELEAWPDELAELDGVVGEVSPAIPSEDGVAVQLFVPIDSTANVGETIDGLRADLAELAPAGTEVYVTGPAGFTGDLVSAFAGIDGILLLVALLAVFVILVIVYRSPLLPLIVLSTSLFALCAALLTVWWIAKAGVFPLSGQTQGILFILVIGAATDYSLLYIARYREALRHHETRAQATRAAVRGSSSRSSPRGAP